MRRVLSWWYGHWYISQQDSLTRQINTFFAFNPNFGCVCAFLACFAFLSLVYCLL